MCNVTDSPKDGSPVTCTEESVENVVYSYVLHLIIQVSVFINVSYAQFHTVHCIHLPHTLYIQAYPNHTSEHAVCMG